MLYIVGTGLDSYEDISLRAIRIIKNADTVYQECYTCIQDADFAELERLVGRRIILADRAKVEERGNEIVSEARTKNVVLLVAGSPLFATTHSDICLRARESGVETQIIHNISIMNVKGCYGLYSYNFGRTVSIPYFDGDYRPISFYDNISLNISCGMHTLVLLDIKTDQNRFMTPNEAIEQLLYAESILQKGISTPDTQILVVSRFATKNEKVHWGRIKDLKSTDFGRPLHSLIIPGALSVIEREFLEALLE